MYTLKIKEERKKTSFLAVYPYFRRLKLSTAIGQDDRIIKLQAEGVASAGDHRSRRLALFFHCFEQLWSFWKQNKKKEAQISLEEI